MKRTAQLTLFGTAILSAAAGTYKVAGHWDVGGPGGWDYAYCDSAAHRLYVSHATKAVVIDTETGKVAGEIADTPGIHGIAVASNAGVGFTSNGRENTVSVFDLKTLAVKTKIKVGENPDAILFEPKTNSIITFNGRSNDATVVSVEGLQVVSTIPLGGKPEFSAADGQGNVWVNIETKNTVIHLAGSPLKVTHTWALEGCEEPSGLAFDGKNRRVFSVCSNKVMTVLNADSGKLLAKLPIGEGADGVAWDPTANNALASAGGDGIVTVVHEDSADKFSVAQTLPTMKSARTIAVDDRTGRAFLPAAETGPPAAGSKRPTIKAGTFQIVLLSH